MFMQDTNVIVYSIFPNVHVNKLFFIMKNVLLIIMNNIIYKL